ncbi:hypothetical protein [uncultured Kiloniella sp.]|uniref:hypothetical protein n=1 Tax=uncultured Kiloniella sp. TaxID=1133091 RepID=UPI00260E54C4|nr:hypothetical protein [uncultured Kiloniella sp.]
MHIAHKAQVPVVMVAFDYKNKQIDFGPQLDISDNIQYELNRIYQYYQNVQGKYPEKMLTDIVPIAEKEIEK